MEVKNGLLDATCEYISREAHYLLCSRERVDDVVHLRAQACVVEDSKFVKPWVVDEVRIAQPEDRVFGMIWIWDDGCNYTNLEATGQQRGRISNGRQTKGKSRVAGSGRSVTHICAGFWACDIVE